MVATGWACLQYSSLKLDNVRPGVSFHISLMAGLLGWNRRNKINDALVLRPAIVCALHLQRLFVKIDYVIVIVIVKAVVGRRTGCTGRSSLVHVLSPYGCKRTLGRKQGIPLQLVEGVCG